MLWIWLGFGLLSAILYAAKSKDINLAIVALLFISGPPGLLFQSVYWAFK